MGRFAINHKHTGAPPLPPVPSGKDCAQKAQLPLPPLVESIPTPLSFFSEPSPTLPRSGVSSPPHFTHTKCSASWWRHISKEPTGFHHQHRPDAWGTCPLKGWWVKTCPQVPTRSRMTRYKIAEQSKPRVQRTEKSLGDQKAMGRHFKQVTQSQARWGSAQWADGIRRRMLPGQGRG